MANFRNTMSENIYHKSVIEAGIWKTVKGKMGKNKTFQMLPTECDAGWFVTNCKLYLSKIAKHICFKFQYLFVSNCKTLQMLPTECDAGWCICTKKCRCQCSPVFISKLFKYISILKSLSLKHYFSEHDRERLHDALRIKRANMN